MAWLKRNVDLGKPIPLSLWRKISISSWRVTQDSSIVAVLEVDAEPALAYLKKLARPGQPKLTLTHYTGQVVAKVFAKHPEINVLYRWGKLYQRKTADICFLVASGTGQQKGDEDLSGHVVREADRKSIAEIAQELEDRVTAIKAGNDITFKGIKQYLSWLPQFMRRPLVDLADFIMHSLNLWTPVLGMKQDAFGSAMLTSVGSLGIEFAIARIYPQSRNSVMLSMGAVKEKPVVREGQIVIRRMLKLVFTADHRVVDGLHAAYLLKSIEEFFENPPTTE